MWASLPRLATVCQICDQDKPERRAHCQRRGRHARRDSAGQVAELLQYPHGAAGAATAHDVQGKHEASPAARGPDLLQLSFFCCAASPPFPPTFSLGSVLIP